jgi:hypothetical protein
MIQRLLAVTGLVAWAASTSMAAGLGAANAADENAVVVVTTPGVLSRPQVNELKIARQALKDERAAMTTQLIQNDLKIKVYQDWFNNKQPGVVKDRALPAFETLAVGTSGTYMLRGAELEIIAQYAGRIAPYLTKVVKGSPMIAAAVAAFYVGKDFREYQVAVSSLDDVRPEDRLNAYRKLLEFRSRALDIIRDESLEINKLDRELRVYEVADAH